MCGAATSSLQRFLSNQWSPKRRTMAMRGLKKESPFSHLSSKFQQAPSPSPRPPTHIQTNLGIIRTLNSANTSRHAFSKEQIKTELHFFLTIKKIKCKMRFCPACWCWLHRSAITAVTTQNQQLRVFSK